jgi:hypothetical protein
VSASDNLSLSSLSLTGWSDLPPEVHRRILGSYVLSFLDLIRLAPTCKLFREAFLDRCDAEELWLSAVAPAIAGREFVDDLLLWLLPAWYEHYGDFPDCYGFGSPALELRGATNQPGPLRWTIVVWPSEGSGDGCGWVNLMETGRPNRKTIAYFEVDRKEKDLICEFDSSPPSRLVPLLSLLLLACKNVRASASAGHEGGIFSQLDVSIMPPYLGESAGQWRTYYHGVWNSAGDLQGEAQRGLLVLRMWIRRFWAATCDRTCRPSGLKFVWWEPPSPSLPPSSRWRPPISPSVPLPPLPCSPSLSPPLPLPGSPREGYVPFSNVCRVPLMGSVLCWSLVDEVFGAEVKLGHVGIEITRF